MSSYHAVINEVIPENTTVEKNNLVLQKDHMKSRRSSNIYNFANSFSTSKSEATTTSSLRNNSIYKKSVSVSMSMERKDSVKYIQVKPKRRSSSDLRSAREEAPCTSLIPVGKNTIIHNWEDNYTEYMAQRVTTTTTAVKTSSEICKDIVVAAKKRAIGRETQKDSSVSVASPSSSTSIDNSGAAALDIDVQVVYGGSSQNLINKRALTMHKQKMIASKSLRGPAKIRSRKESMAFEMPPPPPPQVKDCNEKSNPGKVKPELVMKLKPILKKTPRSRSAKAIETKKMPQNIKISQATALRSSTLNKPQEKVASNESKGQVSCFTQTLDDPHTIFKPCAYLIQDKKCPYQLTCQYLHSDFPCKYYYFNLPCPSETNCRYMHNGPLSPKLMSALRSHLLELLSGNQPSPTDYFFMQQIQNIDDLSKKLKECQSKRLTAGEIIDLDDDDDDDDQKALVIDESCNKVTNENDLEEAKVSESLNPLQNTPPSQQVLALVPRRDLDSEFKIYKEANVVLDEIQDNLQKIKNSSMHREVKRQKLESIYDQLIRQEKTLPTPPTLQTPITSTILINDNNSTEIVTSKISTEQTKTENQQHIILVDPEIVNDIQNTYSQDSVVTIVNEDDNFGDELPNLKELNLNGNSNEILPPRSGNIEISKSKQEKDIVNQNIICVDHKEPQQNNKLILKISTEENLNTPNEIRELTTTNTSSFANEQLMQVDNDKQQQNKIISSVTTEISQPEEKEFEHNMTIDLDSDVSQQESETISLNYNTNTSNHEENNFEAISLNASLQDEDSSEQFIIRYDIKDQQQQNTQTILQNTTSNISNSLEEDDMESISNILSSQEDLSDSFTTKFVDEKLEERNETPLNNSNENILNANEKENNESEDKINLADVELNPNLELENEQHSESLSEETSTIELAISQDEKDDIEGPIVDKTNNDDESPPYENIKSTIENITSQSVTKTSVKPSPRSRIRLRSHTIQDNEEVDFKSPNIQETEVTPTKETPKPLKRRRLRLPKPIIKTLERPNQNECKIDAEVINKLVDDTNNDANKSTINFQDVEAPLTQNVIITNRFMKKAKAKLDQQLKQTNKMEEESNAPDTLSSEHTNVELDMFALHNDNIENFEITICTQTSSEVGGSQPLNSSQDPLIEKNTTENLNNNIATSQNHKEENVLDQNQIPKEKSTNSSLKNVASSNIHLKRHISFESVSSSKNEIKQFVLGNPHVKLTKLKTSLLPPFDVQKQMPADSTTTTTNDNCSNNPTATSSTNSPSQPAVIASCTSTCSSPSPSALILSDDKSLSSHILGQKRRSFTPESDLDSSLKADKILKPENSKNIRKVSLNRERRTRLEQSSSDMDDFNTDSSDEKPTKADALQSSSSTDKKQAFKPSTITTTTTTISTHHVTTQQQHHVLPHEQQQENESDLRQQIENVSNKSDLHQLQSQQQHKQQKHQLQQHKEIVTTNTTAENSNDLPHKQQKHHHQQEQRKQIVNEKIANTCNPYDNIQQKAVVAVVKDEQQTKQQPSPYRKHIDENGEKPVTNLSNKNSNEPISPAMLEVDIKVEESTEYLKYSSSLYNKLSSHTARRQINFENSSVNITPIASPTYVGGGGGDTIASPSPVRGEKFDYRLGGVEIDGRITYPPMAYILREIDLGKLELNKPSCIDKLAKTTHLDPRVFRTQVKKPAMNFSQTNSPTPMTALVPLSYSTPNNSALSSSLSSSSLPSSSAYQTTSISPYDPRTRTQALMSSSTSLTNQNTALSCCNLNSATGALIPSDYQTPAVIPLQHQHHHHQHHHQQHQHHLHPQPVPAPQVPQQTPNMLLYGCLQRSPWYQSLMSTMKIQINQSISQLVRALNNFQRERLLNPDMVFDVFKIDCAGEVLEIMRNLGVFVDANGIINEQRHVSTFAGRACVNTPTAATAPPPSTIPVNATYSFIQQVLTPSSLTTSASSSTYNAAAAAAAGALSGNEQFVSCYLEAPKIVHKHNEENTMPPQSPQDDGSSNSSYSGGNNSYQNGNRRYNNHFKKPYDNNNSQQQRNSDQRNQNPRFNRSLSPNKNSPPNSPPRGGGYGSSGGFGGRGGRGGGRGGGGGGRGGGGGGNFNNRRYNNNSSSWSSSNSPPSSQDNNRYGNRNNRSYNSNNSPTRSSSPTSFNSNQSFGRYNKNSFDNNKSSYDNNKNSSSSPPPYSSSHQSSPPPLSPKAARSLSPPTCSKNIPKNNNSNDEECWDSDN